jgi:alanyl-tRNA synthetase
MHAALKQVLGEHVNQKGSLVSELRLRFDFSHFEAVTHAELQSVEKIVNEQIRANNRLDTKLMNLDEAKAAGAMALFGEKYAEDVRVVSMGDFSMELCGGTHVNRTGDIGFFKIVSEGGIAAGVRRIEAVTGEKALDFVQSQGQQMSQIAGLLKTDPQGLSVRTQQVLEQNKLVEKELEKLKQQIAINATTDVLSQVFEINDVKVLSTVLQGVEAKVLRTMVDDFKNQLGSAVIVLGIAEANKVSLIAGVTKDLVSKVKAGELVNFVAQQVGGKGGGRPDMAQAGGSEPQNLDSAIASVQAWLQEKL